MSALCPVLSRHTCAAVVLCAAAVVSLPEMGHAQTPANGTTTVRETVIVTATLAPAEAKTVGRAVWLLTGRDMAQLGVRSIIEGLRLVPGVDARARGPRDVQTDFAIRGATFGQNLVLVDGMRVNDSQSGHHNGEIPLPAVAVDRIEVVAGAGSAVHGADALGGTINVVSRRGTFAEASAAVGQHGYADVQAVASGGRLPENWALAGWASRSSGFTANRDFAQGGAALRGDVARGTTVDIRHQRRAFGAQGFYGNSDSKEWTNQTLAGVSSRHTAGAWTHNVRGLLRHHADHFLWSQINPGISRNRHRTIAGEVTFETGRRVGDGTWSSGISGGTEDVASTNLKDHAYRRVGAFTEWQGAISPRASVGAGVRFDHYSTFGNSVSPSVSGVVSLSDSLRARASLARAFRVPTFTELYYTDPSNLGSADLTPEHSWSFDGGLDWAANDWHAVLSVFRRWDSDVIDWVRATSADRWRSTNVRDVTARGVEASIARRWAGAFVRVHYAGLRLDAPALTSLSKYVLEYARHQTGGSVTLPIGGGFRAAFNADHRHRRDGQSYGLVSARLSRAVGRAEIAVDGTNLLDAKYHEVLGVAMPGRWVTVGVSVR